MIQVLSENCTPIQAEAECSELSKTPDAVNRPKEGLLPIGEVVTTAEHYNICGDRSFPDIVEGWEKAKAIHQSRVLS